MYKIVSERELSADHGEYEWTKGGGQCHSAFLSMALGLVQELQSTLTLLLSLSIKWSHNNTDSMNLGCARLIQGYLHGAKVRFLSSGLHGNIIYQRRGIDSLYYKDYRASLQVKLLSSYFLNIHPQYKKHRDTSKNVFRKCTYAVHHSQTCNIFKLTCKIRLQLTYLGSGRSEDSLIHTHTESTKWGKNMDTSMFAFCQEQASELTLISDVRFSQTVQSMLEI